MPIIRRLDVDRRASRRVLDDVLLEHECFALLFHRYFRQVFVLAFKILRERSEAEDILHDVLVAIFLPRERFDPTKRSEV